MHDDDFDPRLVQRLRAYESRLPDADAPGPATLGGRRRSAAWPLFLTGGAAVVAGALLAVLLLNRPDTPVGEVTPSESSSAATMEPTSPIGSPSATATATQQPAGSASPSPSAGSPPSALTWTATGSFEGDGGPSIVKDVAVGTRLVAVGVSYRQPLPGVGPLPPHRARIWTSDDGQSWSEGPLGTEWENVRLEHLIVAADGSLWAFGARSVAEGPITRDDGPVAWQSSDGREWTEIDSGLPRTPAAVVQGSAGYLAHLLPEGTGGSELWHSSDGAAWERVQTLDFTLVDVQAGPEGFVAAGRVDDGSAGETRAIASGDGREWFTASNPPPAVLQVAPLGTNWVGVAAFGDGVETGRVWESANGLDWAERGAVPLQQGDASNPPGDCGEYPSEVTGTGNWLIVASDRTYPCSEGAFVVHARQWISRDGRAWEALPFEPGTVGETRSGASVLDAVELGGSVILAGEQDGEATFWLGEAP